MLEQYLKRLPCYKHTWFQFAAFVLRHFQKDRCRDQAAALTYTTLFAVVPMLTVFLVILSSIKALEPARQQIQTLIYKNYLPNTTPAVENALNAFTDKSSNLTVIGVLFLFITTIMMLTSIETAFNRIWRVKETRGGIMGFMRYWTIISLGPILLGSAFVVSSALTSMSILSNNFTGYELNGAFVLWCISFSLTLFGFFILYWTIPNRYVPIKAALTAAAFSTIIFEALKNLFSFLMSNFTSYELVYGAFAAVPIFLLWIFLSWNIILLGVEISFAMTAFTSQKEQKSHPVIMLLDLLELFYQKQKLGKTVTETDALTVLGREELGCWSYYVEILEQQDLIKCTNNNEYVLVRNLSEVDFWSFYQQLPYTLPRRTDIQNIDPNEEWMQTIAPVLIDADQYLAAKLSIPLSKILDHR